MALTAPWEWCKLQQMMPSYICSPLTASLHCSWEKWKACPCALLELEKQLAISLATACAEYLVRRGKKKKNQKRGGKGRIKNERRGWGVGDGQPFITRVIDSRHHARYLCSHYLSFPAHGTVSVSRIILFMTTQVEGILLSCFNSS